MPWNETEQRWDDMEAVFHTLPSASPTPPEEKEVNIEDPNMLDRIFKALASKVVEASDLAKRVGELEYQLASVKAALSDAQGNVEVERLGRLEVQRKLQEVETKLNYEQRAVHDLVMERDIVVGERNEAQAQRDQAKQEAKRWEDGYLASDRELQGERQANAVLQERNNALTARINALKEAFGGLQSL